MTAAASDPAFALVASRFAALRAALDAVPAEADRRIARDALRDALDRDAAPRSDCEIVAGSFTVLRSLHKGAHFEVLLLRQRDAGTLHALKAPLPDRATDPLLRRLLLAEAAHQSRIRHPACLPIGALLRLSDGRPALLTDHVEAPTLAELLQRRCLSEAETIALGIRLASTLAAVHAEGVVHGDVAPGNVFMPRDDPRAAILFDFGLSRPVGDRRTADLADAGTPAFAAPEMRAGDAPLTGAADLFSLGRLLMAVCGRSPGPRLAPLIARLQMEEPGDRPTGAECVAAELGICGTGDTS